MRTFLMAFGAGLAVLVGALAMLAASLGPLQAGPKRDAALTSCKNIYDDQKKSCVGSSSYAACMTMITEKYESCKADANTIVGLQPSQPKPPKAGTYKLKPQPNASQ
jgi:hypothetical protein